MTTSNQNNQQQAEQARGDYPLKLNIASYPRQNRLTTFFRLFTIIPIVIVLGAITALTAGLGSAQLNIYDSVAAIIILLPFGVISIFPGLSAATALMLIFRRKYPRWWFDFHLELLRFSIRVNTYFFLISSVYPSTDKNQNVQLDIDYPDTDASVRVEKRRAAQSRPKLTRNPSYASAISIPACAPNCANSRLISS